MIIASYNGVTRALVTLNERRVLPAPFFSMLLTDQETGGVHLISLGLEQDNNRGQIVTISQEQKEALRSGRYYYRVYETDEPADSVGDLTGRELESGYFLFKDTREIKSIYK